MAEFVGIHRHGGEGFQPLVSFESWQVAILNHAEAVSAEGFHAMERHLETDEVFVLLSGSAFLLVGGDGAALQDVQPMKLESKTVYNVHKRVWHHVVMSRDCSLLIVENAGTTTENSEYCELERHQIERIQDEIEL